MLSTNLAGGIAESANVVRSGGGGGGLGKVGRDFADAELLAADSGCGIGVSPPHHLSSPQGREEEGKGGVREGGVKDGGMSADTLSLSLQERRQQQLKLINEKLAKRHSKLQRKETTSPGLTSKLAVRFEGAPTTRQESTEPKQALSNASSSAGHLLEHMQPVLSRQVPGKSTAFHQEAMTDLASRRHPTEVFTRNDPLPTPPTPLLDSESSFLPVSPNANNHSLFQQSDLEEDVLSRHPEEGWSAELDATSLLSSFTSAYGYSSLAEKARLLSSLVGTEPLLEPPLSPSTSCSPAAAGKRPDVSAEAVTIQSAFRGHLARRRYRSKRRAWKAASLIQAAW